MPYLCANDFEAFKRTVSWHQSSAEYAALDLPTTVIMTDESDETRLREMKKLGWKLLPCFAARCKHSAFFEMDGSPTVTTDWSSALLSSFSSFFSSFSSSSSSSSPSSSSSSAREKPISSLHQLVAEIAVACESRKSVMNMASTFWSLIERLHVRGQDGVEYLTKH